MTRLRPHTYDASIASNDVCCRGNKHAVASLTTAHDEILPPPSLDKRRAPFGEEGESRPDGSSAVTSTGDVCPEGVPPRFISSTPGPIHNFFHRDYLGAPPTGQGRPTEPVSAKASVVSCSTASTSTGNVGGPSQVPQSSRRVLQLNQLLPDQGLCQVPFDFCPDDTFSLLRPNLQAELHSDV